MLQQNAKKRKHEDEDGEDKGECAAIKLFTLRFIVDLTSTVYNNLLCSSCVVKWLRSLLSGLPVTGTKVFVMPGGRDDEEQRKPR